MLQIVLPVLDPLSEGRLKTVMTVECKNFKRIDYTYLEAFGRILAGIAPWLGCTDLIGEEEKIRQKVLQKVYCCLDHATNPKSPDFMNFSSGYQPIVDAAFLAQGILRAPHVLWDPLEEEVKKNVLACLRSTRTRRPYFNNWLLFSAMIECLLYYAGEKDWDPMRIDYAIKQHLQWYKGDGIYGDGSNFHFDYYNSFVIQPMLTEIVEYMSQETDSFSKECQNLLPQLWERLSHYATIQEHMIAPDGSYPLIGRSLCYRFGAFHALSLTMLKHKQEDAITPAGTRCGLTAVIKRIMEFEDNFNEYGFLQIGICGSQSDMGEVYISTGSLYLCSCVFLPLGLPETDSFWSEPDADWTMKILWSGKNRPCEHSIP